METPYFLQALRRRVDRGWFNFRCREVFKTKPVQCDPTSKVVIVSQLYSPDMTMYLLAAKSFARYVRPREFLIVDDGLTEEDRGALQHHLQRVRFVRTRDVSDGVAPKGGCWERLVSLSAENKDHYVIQLDSDTLTISRPEEVIECIAQDRTFTLGTPSGRFLVSAQEAADYAEQHIYDHVQSDCERVLHKMQGAATLKYVRGCAGFTGFARGELPLTGIQAYAQDFKALIGAERFGLWGSEQVTSNLMASNAPNPLVLPVESYPFWEPGLSTSKVVLIHFFGTYRFLGGMYMRLSLQSIRELGR
jgi:hypothetical protein